MTSLPYSCGKARIDDSKFREKYDDAAVALRGVRMVDNVVSRSR